ncbi:MAG: cupin domain-containing protein [Silvibacterium sp.]|nr:cupin domain-containing protein [Silvibacterium sp.]
MKNLSRRDLCCTLPALALLGTAFTEGAYGAADTPSLPAESATYSFDKLPVNRSPNGAATRPVLRGVTPTGEIIELHETTLMPGQMPHPPHKHLHTELMLIREGTVEFIMGDKSEQVGSGGVCYAASNTMHGLKNIGITPANYFVIAIGTEAAHG